MDLDLNGLLYAHSLLGATLAASNRRVKELEAENQSLRGLLSPTGQTEPGEGAKP